MYQAIITFVKTVEVGVVGSKATYPVTEVVRVEFNFEDGYRRLIQDMIGDATKLRDKYGITSIEDLVAK